jgi:hypothetical protein
MRDQRGASTNMPGGSLIHRWALARQRSTQRKRHKCAAVFADVRPLAFGQSDSEFVNAGRPGGGDSQAIARTVPWALSSVASLVVGGRLRQWAERLTHAGTYARSWQNAARRWRERS